MCTVRPEIDLAEFSVTCDEYCGVLVCSYVISIPPLPKVPAIQQRRIVAYLNQFVVHTVRFLNRFSIVCEEVCALLQNPMLYKFSGL